MASLKAPVKSAPAVERQRVSFNPNTQTTGFLDDVDVVISDAQTTDSFDYNGQQAPAPALCLLLTDVNGGEHTQYWTAGKSEDWKATEDNTGFESLSGKNGFSSQSNIAMLFASLAAEGGDDVIAILDSGDVKNLIGMKVHVAIKHVERGGLIRQEKDKDKKSGVLIVTKVIALPGAEGAGAAVAAPKKAAAPAAGKAAPAAAAKGGKPNGAAAATAPAEDDLDETLISMLQVALAEEGVESIAKKDMAKIVFAAVKEDESLAPKRSKLINRINNAQFLASLKDNGFAFDGASVSLEA